MTPAQRWSSVLATLAGESSPRLWVEVPCRNCTFGWANRTVNWVGLVTVVPW
jgi:hypothetical protein